MLRRRIIHYLSIALGAGILAFGICHIHARCDISEGGVLGLSLLIHHWLGISPGISSLVLDGAAMAAGALILEKSFLRDSLIASLAYALWYRLYEFLALPLPWLILHPAVSAVAGGILVGVGTALIVWRGCAAGGDDSLALIFHAKTHLPLPLFYCMSDAAVLAMSLSYIPLKHFAWSLLSVLISSGTITLLGPKKSPEK